MELTLVLTVQKGMTVTCMGDLEFHLSETLKLSLKFLLLWRRFKSQNLGILIIRMAMLRQSPFPMSAGFGSLNKLFWSVRRDRLLCRCVNPSLGSYIFSFPFAGPNP